MGSHVSAKQTLELAPAFKTALLNSSFPLPADADGCVPAIGFQEDADTDHL